MSACSFAEGIYNAAGMLFAGIKLGYKNCDVLNQNEILYVNDNFRVDASQLEDLTFDGTYLWVADSEDRGLYQLDSLPVYTPGKRIDYLKAPSSHPDGLAFDGTYLLHAYNDEFLRGEIHKSEVKYNKTPSYRY